MQHLTITISSLPAVVGPYYRCGHLTQTLGLINMSDLNDPRVLFAAERTLLAWNRTSISLMAFGFLVERFGLFLQLVGREEIKVFQRHISFYVGVSFILLAAFLAIYSIL